MTLLTKLLLGQRLLIRKFTTQTVWEDARIVKTTGIVAVSGSKALEGRFGVFWGPKDKMNVYKKLEPVDGSVVSLPLAELEAVNMALRQAIHELGLNRLIVESDSEFVVKVADRWLGAWKKNDFKKRDGTPVKNREHLEELGRLLTSIEAKILFTVHKTRYDNDVIAALHSNEELAPLIDADALLFSNKQYVADVPKDKTVIYTCGTTRDVSSADRKFILAGYGVHWPGEPELDKCGRFAQFPITQFRAQLLAIITALEQIKKQGLTSVCIITDSDRFLRFYHSKWLKKDGTPVANHFLYKKICELEEGLNVSYSYMPSTFNDDMKQALVLAEDGLAYPVEKQQELSQ